jgi:hypothetical protein
MLFFRGGHGEVAAIAAVEPSGVGLFSNFQQHLSNGCRGYGTVDGISRQPLDSDSGVDVNPASGFGRIG